MVAYGYGCADRLEIKRDDNGNPVTNDSGYAQLQNEGKLTLVGIKGSELDWKKVIVLDKPAGMKGEAITSSVAIPVNKQTLKMILEETDQMYNRFANSPLAKAGGVKPIDSEPPTSDVSTAIENVLPTVEPGAAQ
jgi:hypothetical protein